MLIHLVLLSWLRTLRVVSLTAVGVALVCGASAGAGFGDGSFSEFIGVNVRNEQSNVAYRAMASAGARYARVDLFWGQVETSPGVYDWARLDHFASKLRTYGMLPLSIVDYGNSLYDDGDGITMSSPQERLAYANFAAEAVARYNRPGVVWELWNEPNGHSFWKGPVAGDTPESARQTTQH